MKGILIIIACAVAGYVVVMLLMNTKADDLRPPGDRDDPPPPAPAPETRRLQAPTSSPPSYSSSSSRAQAADWTLLLDVPRSASARDIEAAFRRQAAKAEDAGDHAMVARLKQARDAGLAEKKKG